MVTVSCKATLVSTKLRAKYSVDHWSVWMMQTSRQLNPDSVGTLSVSCHVSFCRTLSKPIAVQYKEKEDRYVDTYKVGSVFPLFWQMKTGVLFCRLVFINFKFIVLIFVVHFLCSDWQTTENLYMILNITVSQFSENILPRKRGTLVVA